MKKILKQQYVLALLAGALLSVAASVATADDQKAGDVNRGAREWATNCVRCHEMRDPTEFSDPLWRPVILHMRLRAGLTGQQTRDILAFIQASNFHVKAPAKAVATRSSAGADGASVYKSTCIACHGPDGKGLLPGTPNFTQASGPLSKSDEVLLGHITNGFQTPGKPLAMPPRGGNPQLDDNQLKAALAYIRAHFGP